MTVCSHQLAQMLRLCITKWNFIKLKRLHTDQETVNLINRNTRSGVESLAAIHLRVD